MKQSNTFSAPGPVSFFFYEEGNEIRAWYNTFGFIKVFLNGEQVASKWHLSTNSFILFNIGEDLYSVQMMSHSSEEILGLCTLLKNGREIGRQKLVFSPLHEPSFNRVSSTITVIICLIATLFATGCLYWDVSNIFYYSLYGVAVFMVVMEFARILRAVPLQVLAASRAEPTEKANPDRPLKTVAILTQSSRKISYAGRMIIFWVSFFVLIVAGWNINYAGEPTKVYSGTVRSQQWISKGLRTGGAFALAKIEIMPGKIVRADCTDSELNQQVIVHEKIAVIFRNTIYQCAK